MDYLHLLFRALETPLGIIVATNDPESLRQRLYAEKRKSPSPEQFDRLSFIISPDNPTSELWIIRTPETSHVES